MTRQKIDFEALNKAAILTKDEAALYLPARARITLKDAVFSVMRQAWAAGTDNGRLPIGARSMYYQVRPLIQDQTDAELEYNYFSQRLLIDYQRECEPLARVYYEPRGELHEPHTGKVVQLGTREVDSYIFPKHLYDKILYVEKMGLVPVFKASRLADRYDMALAFGNGQPVEAIRSLFERTKQGDYQLFVLHDADNYGYTIARVVGEATWRMPGYSVNVTDLGLSVPDAISSGLEPEDFTRERALDSKLELDEIEREWFVGEQIGAKKWKCRRAELNAFTGPDLIQYVEEGLARNGATGKIVPSAELLEQTARKVARDELTAWARDWLEERFDFDSLATQLADNFTDEVVTNPAQWVTDAHQRNPSTSWNAAIDNAVQERVNELETELETELERILDS